MSTQKTPSSRSWGGCTRCRRRRQKCSEQKPSCQRCLAASAFCAYQAPLKWGGRSFSSSRFGKVLNSGPNGGVTKLRLDDGAFIYATPQIPAPSHPTIVSKPIEKESEDDIQEATEIHLITEHGEWRQEMENGEAVDQRAFPANKEENRSEQVVIQRRNLSITRIPTQITALPSSTAFERQLLHHFIHNASRATSCHSLVQEDVCRMILPMAMGNPALFSATLVLSAIHQKTLGHPVQAMIADQKIAGLKTASLQYLRSVLARPQRNDLNVILATVRTLCLAEVYDGDHRTRSWRAHFDGARALLEAQDQEQGINNDEPAEFLQRWFSVTEGLISLTPDGISTKVFEEEAASDSAIRFRLITDNTVDDEGEVSSSETYLDEYTGCSTDLSGLFRDIGLAIGLHQRNHELAHDRICSDYHCSMVATRLEKRIRYMISRDQVGKVMFHPKTASKLSRRQVLEFALCNRAYQYSALLHIQRRLYDQPAVHHDVQEVVNMIIGCVEGVHPAEGLSPLAVLTTPVFVAGCEAFGHDRARVRKLLDIMYTSLRIPNMRRALGMLEKYWASGLGDQLLDWAQFSKSQDYDFLPY